ncbi:vitamin B6 photo-protection and homoeostasis-domain-containing protein [Hyaloraphidium curvatum]|nr:vitamin B6 photo-protection and homoeostasis-domain-containing protein [Hyaloraphidium curvatum]
MRITRCGQVLGALRTTLLRTDASRLAAGLLRTPTLVPRTSRGRVFTSGSAAASGSNKPQNEPRILQIVRRQGLDVTWEELVLNASTGRWEVRARTAEADAGAAGEPSDSASNLPAAQRLRKRLTEYIVVGFLPKGYPSSVAESYLPFTMWNMVSNVTGTLSNVLSLQALLYAVGVGAGSVPMAAGINWVLKDGAGQLGGVIYASIVSSKFDAQPKHYRFSSAALLNAAVFLELLTPLFPHLFVLSASLSNVGKNISWLATGAARAAINKTFLVRDNLGDLTGKSGAQATAAGLMGTGLGVLLSLAMPSSHPLALCAAFAPLAALNMYAIHASCKYVSSPTLDVQRAEILLAPVVERILRGASDPSPKELCDALESPVAVGRKERFSLPPAQNARAACFSRAPLHLEPAISSHVLIQNPVRGTEHAVAVIRSGGVCLWFLQDARAEGVIRGYFRAALLRGLLDAGVDPEEAVSRSGITEEKLGAALLESMRAKGWDTENQFLGEAGRRIRFED